MDEKKQVLVIQTIVPPEILPDWNQDPQLKSGGGVSNNQNITYFLCSDFYVDRPTVNVDISHCSGWSQSWHIKLYRPSVWKLCLNLNSISV